MIDYEKIFSTPRKREELPSIFNTSDRMARIHIEHLQGYYILINFQDGKGYFIGDDKQGIAYSFQEMNRGKSSLEKACKIIAQCHIENIEDMERFIEEMTYCISLLNKSLVPIKNELYERKNIKCVPVRQHLRRVGTGDLQGQCRIEVG